MIIGKNINLRKVTVQDAKFILSLRLNPELNKFLSPVADDLCIQKQWLEKCLKNISEWYFIVENKNQDKIGTIRIYDTYENKFCWGSWIILPNSRYYATLESIVILFKYAFYNLFFDYTIFDVRKQNEKALNFYLRFGAKVIKENEIDYFLQYDKELFLKNEPEYFTVINQIKYNK